MYRGSTNYIGSSSSLKFKYLSLASICLIIGAVVGTFIDRNLHQEPENKVSSHVVSEQVQLNEEYLLLKQELQRHKIELEELHLNLHHLKSEISDLSEIEKLREFTNELRLNEFHVAEVTRHRAVTDQARPEICLLKSGGRIEPGDLIVAQGVLLGEIAEIQNECFSIIPVYSQLSSFEVELEKSGVKGVAIGLGSQKISDKNESTEVAIMELKYLERAQPAIIGERALLIRKTDRSSTTKGKYEVLHRLPSLTIGEVIKANIDENGLFQSAFLTSPLSRVSVDFVVVLPIKNLMDL